VRRCRSSSAMPRAGGSPGRPWRTRPGSPPGPVRRGRVGRRGRRPLPIRSSGSSRSIRLPAGSRPAMARRSRCWSRPPGSRRGTIRPRSFSPATIPHGRR
jgi:hypothetical protein